MAEALAFWCVAIAIGALALPLAFRLFARFPDAGAGLSYALGLTLVSTAYFILRVLGALPPGRGGFLFALALLAVLAFVLAVRDRRLRQTCSRALPALLIAGGLFSLLFFGYVAFRAYTPAIAHTEQPMDFLYLNAMLVSPDYPPHDPWFAGESASYYYGGYLQAALLTGAADVWPATGYNLALAAFFAGAGTAAFSLAAALARWFLGRRGRRWVPLGASLAVVLLLLAGPLASAFELASAHGAAHRGVYEAFGVEGLVRCGPQPQEPCRGLRLGTTASWRPDDPWNWWRMSRMSYWGPQPGDGSAATVTTITEAPVFSFLLGDLHPHLMSIPGVLLALALCAALWRARAPLSWRDYHRRPWLPPVAAAVFGSLAFVNLWDGIVFAPVLALAVFARNWRAQPFGQALEGAVSWLLPPAVLAALLFMPWWLGFSPGSDGSVGAYAGRGTRIEHVLLMWGVLLAPALFLLWYALKRSRLRPSLDSAAAGLTLTALPLLAWALLIAFGQTDDQSGAGDRLSAALEARAAGAWLALALYAGGFWLLTTATLVLFRRRPRVAPVLALAAVGVLLLYGTELFFVRDGFAGSVPRLNTVFKLSYQAWLALSLAGAVGVAAAIAATPPRFRPLAAAPMAALLGASLVLLVTMSASRADDFGDIIGLDGLHHVQRDAPGEYELVAWVAGNVPPDAIIVEGSGRLWVRGEDGLPLPAGGGSAYRPQANRVGYRTGVQTPIGWRQHEETWRGASPEIPRRQDLVDRVYTAPAAAEALAALHELGARYVVVGAMERNHYPEDLMPPFGDFLDTVFSSGEVTVYRLPVLEPVNAP